MALMHKMKSRVAGLFSTQYYSVEHNHDKADCIERCPHLLILRDNFSETEKKKRKWACICDSCHQ